MPSISSSFEYDIFISYRHNDNRSGWVTEFVKALQEELAATIKEPVSVYFDTNPHDGLLETHNVSKSLEGKLKCLIFIPIISQTYCDVKSFAWQHEFCAFNKLAKEDQLGRDIKLGNGNVASRILPIKIHDLDAEDNAIIENEIEGALRAIEFIYKESGVNRPLKLTDSKHENQNKTDYRNQVNKAANAVKEIVASIKNPLPHARRITTNEVPVRPEGNIKKSIAIISLLFLLGLAGYFLYPKLFVSSNLGAIDKSIAVLPFVNMSADPEQEYFSDGISEEVLNLLAKIPQLKVTGRTSSFYYKGKNEDLRIIGQKLGVAYVLEGSVRREGEQLRITAQLIRTSDGTHLWSETYDRKLEGIFKLQDEIAADVLKELKLKLLGLSSLPVTKNSEAHNLFLKGNYYFNKADIVKAVDFYQRALKFDSSDAATWTALATTKFLIASNNFMHAEENFLVAKRCAEKALALDENFSDAHRVKGLAELFDFKWDKAELEFNMALKLDPNNSEAYRNMGILKSTLGRSNEALNYFKKSVELNPLNFFNLNGEGWTYLSMKEYEQAANIYKEVAELNPGAFKWFMFTLYLYSDQPQLALKYLNELGIPEGDDKIRALAMIDYLLGKKEKAIKMVRNTLGRYHDSNFDIAGILAFMNEKDEAFKWLEKSLQERFRIIAIKQDPGLANLRGDPRYVDILKRMHLPLE